MRASATSVLVLLVVLNACSQGSSSAPDATARGLQRVASPSELDESNPLFEVPDDPLGLAAAGWSVTQRETVAEYVIDDAYLCNEQIEGLAKGFLALTYEVYRPPPDQASRWLDVAYIDYGDAELLSWRLSGYADIESSCEGDETAVEAWAPPSVPEGYATQGLDRRGSLQSWIVTDGETRAVVFNGSELSVDTVQSLNERAVVLLRETPRSGTTAP